MKAKRLTEISLLTTIALIIFVVELQIPPFVAIPGIKLGLANVITVYTLHKYSKTEITCIIVVRILLGAIFSGNVMSIPYSLAGGLLCLLGMEITKSFVPISQLWFCSVIGAICHNIGQIMIAYMIMGKAILAYFPFMLVSGCITGFITGTIAQFVYYRMKIFEELGMATNLNSKK